MRDKIKYSKKTKKFRLDKSGISIKAFVLDAEIHHNKWCNVIVDESGDAISLTIEQTNETIIADDDLTAIIEEKKAKKVAEQQYKAEREKIIQKQENSNDSFFLERTFIPSDTKRLITDSPDNFHLKLNKFARFEYNERDYSKSKFKFAETSNSGYKYRINADFSNIDFREICKRQSESISLPKTLMNVDTESKTVVGLGGASVYETSLTLHHIYGFPYIPATILKGVVRNWIINSYFGVENVPETEADNPLQNAERRALQNENFCKLFGCSKDSVLGKESKGEVVFYDAFPTNAPEIEPDIMNPHFGQWYGSKEGNIKPPTDTGRPVPVLFLVVKNCSFQIITGSKNSIEKNLKIGNKNLSQWLKSALTNHGIGAKTAVGYGYMQAS